MTNYENGANFERRVKKLYESNGWFCVRSAGSHGPVDLICIKGASFSFTQILLIQVKIPGRREKLQELHDVAYKTNAKAVYVWREPKAPYRIRSEELGFGEKNPLYALQT